MNVFRAWEDWALFSYDFLNKLQNIFLGLQLPKVFSCLLEYYFTVLNSFHMQVSVDTNVDGIPLDPDVDGVPVSMDDVDGNPSRLN